MLNYPYKSDLPYPETKITQRSIYEIRLLMPSYGGKESETTAIMGYVYQSYVISESFPEIAKCLEQIGITEMHHHEMLGSAITMLGGTPYIGGNNTYWQGGYVNYARDVRQILMNDIEGEKNAIRGYEEIVINTQMPEIKEMIERIIIDEKVHVETLTAILQNL